MGRSWRYNFLILLPTQHKATIGQRTRRIRTGVGGVEDARGVCWFSSSTSEQASFLTSSLSSSTKISFARSRRLIAFTRMSFGTGAQWCALIRVSLHFHFKSVSGEHAPLRQLLSTRTSRAAREEAGSRVFAWKYLLSSSSCVFTCLVTLIMRRRRARQPLPRWEKEEGGDTSQMRKALWGNFPEKLLSPALLLLLHEQKLTFCQLLSCLETLSTYYNVPLSSTFFIFQFCIGNQRNAHLVISIDVFL